MGHTENKKGWHFRLKAENVPLAKIFKMCRICFAFAMSGWVAALDGPTFPELRLIIDKDLDTSSWLFTVTSFGVFVGSGVASFLWRLKQKNLIFSNTLLCFAIAVLVVPWCPYFYLMLAAKFCVGLFASILNAGCIFGVASIWKENSGFYMQILHFCYSLGAIISPLVSRPFLAPNDIFSNGACQLNKTKMP